MDGIEYMVKTVSLHVGLPKTGTTTLQHFLRDNSALLRAVGYCYPNSIDHPAMVGQSDHQALFNAIAHRPNAEAEGMDPEACRRLVGQVFHSFRDDPALTGMIWSQEAMAMSAPRWNRDYLADLLRGFEVRVLVCVRFTDDWIESLQRELIWARVGRKTNVFDRTLRPISAERQRGDRQSRKGMVEHGEAILAAIEAIVQNIPQADVQVLSFDEAVRSGRVVSTALAALGIPADHIGFADADAVAGVRNPTKSPAFTLLVHQLLTAGCDRATLQPIARALRRRSVRREQPEWLEGRRFRFLPDDAVLRARAAYERLRATFPHLPIQPDPDRVTNEHVLSVDESELLLNWIKPDIPDAAFDAGLAAIRTFR